ncbi:hypothetical protein KJ612_07040 [Myxococcota bacterium]|nr:hypothetical protein [Myxococcota bacterium]MBU1413542.1 hypothetical protein [Myxococcota bacterium]
MNSTQKIENKGEITMHNFTPLTPEQALVGHRVIITFNPHERTASDVYTVGSIESAPVPGPLAATLVDVRYPSPADGTERTMPIALHNLAEANASALTALAEQHEAKAAEYRRLADQAKT